MHTVCYVVFPRSVIVVWGREAVHFTVSPVYATQLSKAVTKNLNASFNGHVHAKHLALSLRAPIDHRYVDGPCFPLGEGHRDTDIGVKGAGASATRWADDGRAELALEETLDEALVAFHVASQCLCSNILIWTPGAVLCEMGGEEGGREGEEIREGGGKRKEGRED